MAFTLSGTTIIQSGTDADPSGLIGIAGVTKNGLQYTLDGVRLEVNGDLTINGFSERLRFINSPTSGINNSAAQIAVRSGATFTVEASRTINGGTVNRALPVIDFGVFSIQFGTQSFLSNRRHLESDVGATVNLSGVFTADSRTDGLAYAFDGTTNLTDVFFINQGSQQGSNQQVAFNRGGDVTILNCVAIGYAYTDRSANFLSINGFSVAEDTEGLVWGGGSNVFTEPIYVEVNGYDSDQIAGAEWRTNIPPEAAGGSVANLINSRKGNNIAYINSQVGSSDHRLIVTNRLIVSPLTSQFLPANVKVWARDVDNGNRGGDFTPPGQSLIAASSDIIYEQTGSNITLDIISGIFNPDQTLDARGLSGGSDLAFKAIAYGFLITSFQPSLTGLGDKTSSPIMLADPTSTERDKAIIEAYTELDTAQKLYDYAESYLVDNYDGEEEFIVSRTGDTIDAGSYDVELRSGGSNVFEFDGTTITVRVGTSFTGNITTTGTVTFQGSATINGFIIDANGDSFLAPVGIDSYTVHDTEADSNANLNPLGGGTGDEIFRFNFIAPRIYYVRAIAGGVVFQIQVSVAESGRTEISLSELAVLQSIKATTDSIKTRQATLNRNIQKGSLSIPATEELTNE